MTTTQERQRISSVPFLGGVHLHIPYLLHSTDEAFFVLCTQNPDLDIERSAKGDWEIMAPAGGESGGRNFSITGQLYAWARSNSTGVGFDSSTGFVLPDGAIRSPDASWVLRSRLTVLTPEQKQRFLPLCPDFVIELRSQTDNLPALQEKMEEYIANGARLGWLIDPVGDNRVFIYRPGTVVEERLDSATISADPELPGFTLDLTDIWTPPF